MPGELPVDAVIEQWIEDDPDLDVPQALAWLTSAARLGRWPTETELGTASVARRPPTTHWRHMSGVYLDMTHTHGAAMVTGVERVCSEVAARWLPDQAAPCRWTGSGLAVAPWPPPAGKGASARLQASPHFVRRLEQARLLDAARRLAAVRHDRGRAGSILLPMSADLVVIETIAGRTRRTFSMLRAAARATPLRVHFVAHDLIPLTEPEWILPGAVDVFASYAASLGIGTSIVANSRQTLDEVRAWLTLLQPLGEVRTTLLELPPASPTSAPGSSPRERRVVAVGALEPRKNYLRLLRAAESLWGEGLEFDLVVVASPRAGGHAELREIERLKEAGRPVRVVSNLGDGELADLVGTARVLAQVSLREGFGLPVVEALRLGTPVVGGDAGVLGELGAQDGVARCDVRDADSIAWALRLLLTDDSMWSRMHAAAMSRDWSSWDAYARELLDRVLSTRSA